MRVAEVLIIVGVTLLALIFVFAFGVNVGKKFIPMHSIEKAHCVDNEYRLLVKMPDSSTKWIRGKEPIPCR